MQRIFIAVLLMMFGLMDGRANVIFAESHFITLRMNALITLRMVGQNVITRKETPMTPYKADSWWAREYRDKRILKLHADGLPIWQIAEETHYSESHIQSILQHYKLTGEG
jgi:DNA-binding NarL/FixJ family response regulator